MKEAMVNHVKCCGDIKPKNEKCQLSLATLFGRLIGPEIRPQWAEG